ncbi:MAG: tetratricopeptide repeat protein [Bacteroidia bacterium]|nr:tetratricopeptide repeat protein [Bacteroidia bacterium]
MLVHTCFSISQNTKIDSLKGLIRPIKKDSSFTKTLFRLADAYETVGENDSAIKYLNAAIFIGQEINYKRIIASSNTLLGRIHLEERQYLAAKDCYIKALAIDEELNRITRLDMDLSNLGITYHELGDYTRAAEFYFRALKISDATADTIYKAKIYSCLGDLYYDTGDFQKSLNYHLQSLKTIEHSKDKFNICARMQRVGDAYSQLKKYNLSLEYYLKALDIAKKNEYAEIVAISLTNIGSTYAAQIKHTEALKYYNEALKIFKDLGVDHQVAIVNFSIGECFLKMEQYTKAEKYLLNSLPMIREEYEMEMEKQLYNVLSELYLKTKKYKEAHYFLKAYHQLNDSLFSIEKLKDLTRKELNYEFEKKQALTKAEHEKELAISEAEEKRQRLFSWFIAALAVSIGIISLVIYRSLQLTKKQKQIIEAQKQQVEEHQKEIIDSITYAKRLQEAILPPLDLISEKLPNSFVLYKPKDIVAGDFYWMEEQEDTVFIAAADCTGHGVPGALVSVVCSNALNRAVKEFGLRETGKILDKVRDLVLETFEKSSSEVKDGMDISLLSINHKSKKIQWSGANNPLWYITSSELKEIKADKQAIGKTESPAPFTTHEIVCEGAANFYLFTDGFADQFGGPAGKKFKYKQFSELLLSLQQHEPKLVAQRMEHKFNEWKGNLDQVDDVCVIGINM